MRTWTGWTYGLALAAVTASSTVATTALTTTATAADIYKLPVGSPELKSAGPLAFASDGILLIGDNKAAAIVAIQTGDKTGEPAGLEFDVSNLNAKIAEAIGGDPQAIQIADLAVNPWSGNVYLSVSSGERPAIVKVDGQGIVSKVSLENVGYSRAELPNAPEDKVVGEGRRARNNRGSAITDLAFVDGQVIVSGLTNSASPSSVRTLQFPFEKVSEGANLEIFHAAHGKVEDYAPIRTFVPFTIEGKPSLLAGFVCTPLVRFDLSAVQSNEKVKGTTIAELGNRNQPLSMIVYKKDGKDYLLLANSARGVMKISTAEIEDNAGLKNPVNGGGTAGQPFETVEALAGTIRLDRLDDNRAVVLMEQQGQPLMLKTVPLP